MLVVTFMVAWVRVLTVLTGVYGAYVPMCNPGNSPFPRRGCIRCVCVTQRRPAPLHPPGLPYNTTGR